MLANTALLLASLSLSVIGLELLLGRFVPELRPYSAAFTGPRMPLTSSPYLPATTPSNVEFDHKTNEFDVVYRFNEFGYRGKYPQSLEKEPGRKRILVLGDSFTLGWGNNLEDTFVQRVSDSLEADDYEVINAGYRGFLSPDAYYAYLETEGMTLEPDIVIVVLHSGNDVAEMRDSIWRSLDARRMPRILNTIRLYTDYNGDFLFPPGSRDKLVGWNYRVPVLRESRAFIGLTQLINKAFALGPVYQPRFTFHGKLQEPLSEAKGWSRFKLTVRSLNRACSDAGATIVYALIPPRPHGWQEDREEVLNRMRTIITKSGAWSLDAEPHLTDDHYFREGHFNPAGNEIFAQQMVEFLRENRLVSPTVVQ